jgi:hypothetical protein
MGEYVLISTSVLSICLVALFGFGHHFQAWLMDLSSNLEQQTQKTPIGQVEVAQAPQNLKDNIAQNKESETGNLGGLRVSSSDPNVVCGQDFCVSAPGLTGAAVSTAGSNGNINITESAADIYTQLAQIMKAKGADENTVGLLTRLANQGHSIANLQNQLLQNRSVQRNYLSGNSKSASLKLSDHYQNMSMESDSMEQALANFKQLSAQMNSSLDNYPAEARPLLTKAAQVVVQSGSGYYFWKDTKRTGQPIVRFRIDGNKVGGKVALIHANSNTICDNGGDQSKCHRS